MDVSLQDFVSETLKQVIGGVVVAQDYAKDKGAYVNPYLMPSGDGKISRLRHSETGTFPGSVDFDVAVTTVKGTETQGGIGIFVGPVALGSKGQSESSSSSVSRIKFSVPVAFPPQSK